MDSRTPLKNGYELVFSGADGGKRKFFVEDVLGYGASCIVYGGYYRNNHGRRKSVRIKECYPHKVFFASTFCRKLQNKNVGRCKTVL